MTHQGTQASCISMLTLGLIWFAASHLSAQNTPPVQPEPTPAPGVEPATPQELDAIRRALQLLIPVPNADQPNGLNEPPDKDDGAQDQNRPTDSFDKLIPVDADIQSEWSRAQRQASNGNWGQILQIIKRINDRKEDSLTVQGDGTVISMRRSALQLLGKAPRSVLETFDRTQRGEAERKLKEALAESDLDKLADVATRYFWMEPGFVAADSLAARLLDRGDVGIALSWLKLLWEAQPPLVERLAWKRRALVTARLCDDANFERLMIEELGKDANSEALLKIAQRATPSHRPLSDWPLFLGSADRIGFTSGSDAVGLERWRQQTTSSMPLQESVDDLLENLLERKTPSIPTAMPLMVNGKVVYRSFSGLEVLDAETGRSQWSLEDPISAESMLQDGSTILSQTGQSGEVFLQSNVRLRTGGALGQYLYQNSNHSLLSSDGVRLFAVDDNPLISLYLTSGRMQVRGARETGPNRVGANTLRAYDLETGRTLWQVGGVEMKEDLQAQLAGSFILGAPVPDGEELFLVAQKDLEIRLHVLEASTGHVKWSQLLSYADLPIERDAQRRVWAIQPAIKGSVVLCPTTAGWLVAVDRTRHAVLWAQRYFDRLPEQAVDDRQPQLFAFAGGQVVRNLSEDIGSRWATSAPLIVRNRVLVTPIESRSAEDAVRLAQIDDANQVQRNTGDDSLQCLDLFSGRRLWKVPREKMQYVAGVWNDLIVLVSDTDVRSLTLNGQQKWITAIPRNDFTPSGRGVIADGFLYQPTLQRTVLKIDLSNGRVAKTLDFTNRSRPLGNLLMYRNLLISHHPGEILALEQVDAVLERLAATSALSPRPVDSILLEAELALSERRAADAMKLLVKLPRSFETASQQTRFEDAYRSAMLLVATSSTEPAESRSERSESLITELDQLVRTPIHQRQVDELSLQQLLDANQHMAAVKRLLVVARRADESLAPRAVLPQQEVSGTAWVEAQFRELFSRLMESERGPANQLVRALLKEVEGSGSTVRLQAVVRMLQASPTIGSYARQFAKEALAEREYVAARNWLQLAARVADSRAERCELIAQEAQVCVEFQDAFSASRLMNELETEPGEMRLPTGQSLATRLQTLKDMLTKLHRERVTQPRDPQPNGELPAAASGDKAEAAQALEKVRLQHLAHVQSTPTVSLQSTRRRADFFSRLRVEMLRFEYSAVAERITWVDAHSNQIYWSTPLRSRGGDTTTAPELQFKRAGTTQIVFNGGVLMGLSLPDRRVLWTLSPETSGATDSFGFEEFEIEDWAEEGQPDVPEPNSLAAVDAFSRQVTEFTEQTDQLLFANSQYLVVRAKQVLLVIDAVTGEVRWTLKKLGHRSIAVTGTQDTLWIWERGATGAAGSYAFRSSDGAPMPVTEAELGVIKSTVFADDDVIVSCEASKTEKPKFKAYDHAAKRTLWEQTFDVGTHFCRVTDDEVLAFSRNGQLSRLDLTTGQRAASEVIPAKVRLGRLSRRVATDRDHVYLLLNPKNPDQSLYFSGDQEAYGEVPVLPANGKLLVFDRQSMRLLWQTDTNQESLLLTEFVDNPTLLLLRYDEETLRFGGELKLRVLAKNTGKELLNQPIASDHLSFSNVFWDGQNQTLDLFAFERRFRLLLK